MLSQAVVVTDILAVIDDAGKGKLPAVKGGKLGAEIFFPGVEPFVLADDSMDMELLQILFGQA